MILRPTCKLESSYACKNALSNGSLPSDVCDAALRSRDRRKSTYTSNNTVKRVSVVTSHSGALRKDVNQAFHCGYTAICTCDV
mmetsp:Transcript_2419/g.3887  ORF Transcript_2419/g.3887 Transcript_2419/m.3887 type:complete len:83 (+) Transcript_2419:558-806(+)